MWKPGEGAEVPWSANLKASSVEKPRLRHGGAVLERKPRNRLLFANGLGTRRDDVAKAGADNPGFRRTRAGCRVTGAGGRGLGVSCAKSARSI